MWYRRRNLDRAILACIRDSKEMETLIRILIANNQLRRDKLIADLEMIRIS